MSEYQVKALFLLNFVKYVDWPGASGPIVIGIMGQDNFGTSLSQAIEGKNLTVRATAYEKGGVTTALEQRPTIDWHEKIEPFAAGLATSGGAPAAPGAAPGGVSGSVVGGKK